MSEYMEISEDVLREYSQCLVGELFSSKKFGIGKCLSVEEKSMHIDFGEQHGIRLIAFPKAITDNLVLLDDPQKVLNRIETIRLSEGTEKIREQLNRRGIKSFVHFTRVKNLKSIIKYGICSIEYMDKHGITYIANDNQRLDRRTDSISLSVTFPNYLNFFTFYNREKEDWCFILLDPQKVISLDCAFFWTNAANRMCRNLLWEKQNGRLAFEKMFDNNGRNPFLPACFTTDPQAEIMVKDLIPADYIDKIVFGPLSQNKIDLDYLPYECVQDYRYFGKREDYLNDF